MCEKSRGGNPVGATAELWPQPGQEVVQMSGDEPGQLQQHDLGACHEQAGAHHAERDELSWDGEEEESSFLASLILSGSVAHGENQGLQEVKAS